MSSKNIPVSIDIEEELKKSYLDYAMSVIIGRALPDVRDGLKPVHRRILFAMHQLGNEYNKSYKKSARIVGDVIGKYHPHGDSAIYQAIVRMAQTFSMRYMLIDGQGNFGSIDGDLPAAMRYTEVRMSKFANTMLQDLNKKTVDMVFNYDETELVPVVLPTKIPNLLVNGSNGIAVGMATNIPPHNLNEIVDGCLAFIKNPNLNVIDLMQYIPGPDFPTAAIINGNEGIIDAYTSGRGKIYIRAKTKIESHNFKDTIVVTELPYQVNKSELIKKIAELIREKKIEGILELRDESDKDGMRIIISLRKGENTNILLNKLFSHTQMEVVFGINSVALYKDQPKLFNLKEMIKSFIEHRKNVILRKTKYDLKKTINRTHILEGLHVSLNNVEEIILLIKTSKNLQEAKNNLRKKRWFFEKTSHSFIDIFSNLNINKYLNSNEDFGLLSNGKYQLSKKQINGILELRLSRLTSLEKDKILNEISDLLEKIKYLSNILSNPNILMEEICIELKDIKNKFGDPRRTRIIQKKENMNIEDLITKEDMIITLSKTGYIKAQALNIFQSQHRGGKGKSGLSLKKEDFVQKSVIANTHETMLYFSTIGKVYWKKVYELPKASRISRGRPIINVFALQEGEFITEMLPISNFLQNAYIFMGTRNGIVKKTILEKFSKPRNNGIIAIKLDKKDLLIGAKITDGSKDVMLFSNSGKSVRFNELNVRAIGRNTRGIKGMQIQKNQSVISLIIVDKTKKIDVLTVTQNGYGKKTSIKEYRCMNRGTKGVVSIQTSKRNGKVIGVTLLEEKDEILLVSSNGIITRISSTEISRIRRNTQGVRLMRLSKGEKIVSVECIKNKLANYYHIE